MPGSGFRVGHCKRGRDWRGKAAQEAAGRRGALPASDGGWKSALQPPVVPRGGRCGPRAPPAGPAHKKLHKAPLRAFKGFEIPSRRELEGTPRSSIHHVAHTPDLTNHGIRIWRNEIAPEEGAGGMCLSDHFGVWGKFTTG